MCAELIQNLRNHCGHNLPSGHMTCHIQNLPCHVTNMFPLNHTQNVANLCDQNVPDGHTLIGSEMCTPMCSQCAQWTHSVSFKMWCDFLGLCWTHGKNRPNLDHNLNMSTGHIVNTLGCTFQTQLECAHQVHFDHINWLYFGCN